MNVLKLLNDRLKGKRTKITALVSALIGVFVTQGYLDESQANGVLFIVVSLIGWFLHDAE